MIALCLHEWKTHKILMDQHPLKKDRLKIKEIHKCKICGKSKTVSYSQTYDIPLELKND